MIAGTPLFSGDGPAIPAWLIGSAICGGRSDMIPHPRGRTGRTASIEDSVKPSRGSVVDTGQDINNGDPVTARGALSRASSKSCCAASTNVIPDAALVARPVCVALACVAPMATAAAASQAFISRRV